MLHPVVYLNYRSAKLGSQLKLYSQLSSAGAFFRTIKTATIMRRERTRRNQGLGERDRRMTLNKKKKRKKKKEENIFGSVRRKKCKRRKVEQGIQRCKCISQLTPLWLTYSFWSITLQCQLSPAI